MLCNLGQIDWYLFYLEFLILFNTWLTYSLRRDDSCLQNFIKCLQKVCMRCVLAPIRKLSVSLKVNEQSCWGPLVLHKSATDLFLSIHPGIFVFCLAFLVLWVALLKWFHCAKLFKLYERRWDIYHDINKNGDTFELYLKSFYSKIFKQTSKSEISVQTKLKYFID